MADRITRTPVARSDLIAIWEFTAADNEVAADRFLDRIDRYSSCSALIPSRGVVALSFPVGNYILFYRSSREGIMLVRVLNGYKDIQPETFDT